MPQIISVRIAGVPFEIRTDYIQNKIQMRYVYTNRLSQLECKCKTVFNIFDNTILVFFLIFETVNFLPFPPIPYLTIKHKVYNTKILHSVLYGHETWSLALKEHDLSVFANSLLRNIFGTKARVRHSSSG
jgi:hypothetical protein